MNQDSINPIVRAFDECRAVAAKQNKAKQNNTVIAYSARSMRSRHVSIFPSASIITERKRGVCRCPLATIAGFY